MAGNLVKWWKHKILGGYKQFSVQECTTDSEELMYHQVRASSSCSAPPDLLLVSDRENNIPLRSPVVNIIGGATTSTTAPATLTTTSPSSGINACPITSVTNNNQRHHQKLLQHQQQQQQLQQHHHHVTTQQLSLAYNGTKDGGKHQKNITGFNNSSTKHNQQQQQQQQQDLLQQQHLTQENEAQQQQQQVDTQTTTNNHSSTRHAHHSHHHQQQQQQQQQQHRNEEQHIRLEEFTCDVSVEGGKSSQPLQFSFTFYDLDGHHGKITKDDIVGIVYTIYESIGKSVVVPHSGSKTINVRLTVSPEGKSKSAKTKKTQPGAVILDNSTQKASATANPQATRRLHRYRPRKLIKSDEEDDDSNSDKEQREANLLAANLSNILPVKSSSKSHKTHKLKVDPQPCCATDQKLSAADLPNSPLESIYDNLKTATTPETCQECMAAVNEDPTRNNAAVSPTTAASLQIHHSKSNNPTTTTTPNEAYMKHVASTRIKMLRKSRKQKHQDCIETTRQRSLSVGNETCWKNRHLQKQPTQQQLQWQAEQQLQNTDTVDGVQLRNPLKAAKASLSQKRSSAECWKTALNRNDLISIIRESMEKNRLCFQLNGKPQANVSPIRHSQQQHQPQQHHLAQPHNKHSQQQHPQIQPQRQRSNTVSKIPTLIAHHNNVNSVSPQSHSVHRSSSCTNNSISHINNNNDTSLHEQHNTSNNSIYHPQPHIPIYHQQMAINPAVIAAQNALNTTGAGGVVGAGHHHKMNLCGYDSFLHATICGGGGGLSHSPPPPPPHPTALNNLPTSVVAGSPHIGHHQQQQIATVQPIMSSGSTNPQNTPKHQMGLAVSSHNQIKTSKILRSGSYAQAHQQTLSAANSASPQYHGYQRLSSASKHNLAALHLVSPTMEKPQIDQLDKWRRDQVKNYDQLLYAKLSEKLQQTNLVTPNRETREINQRRKHRMLRQRRSNAYVQEANNISLPTVLTNKLCIQDDNEYATMMPINVDPVECENLIGQTSDEESHSHHEPLKNTKEQHTENLNQARHVVEGTLVDLDDVNITEPQHQDELINKLSLNVDTLLTVQDDEDHNMHLEDDLEIDEDLDNDLEDLEEVVGLGVGNGLLESDGRQSAASNDTNSGGCGANLANTNAANTSTTSSSLIHRYVHEHIHHHYHHFEEKEE